MWIIRSQLWTVCVHGRTYDSTVQKTSESVRIGIEWSYVWGGGLSAGRGRGRICEVGGVGSENKGRVDTLFCLIASSHSTFVFEKKKSMSTNQCFSKADNWVGQWRKELPCPDAGLKNLTFLEGKVNSFKSSTFWSNNLTSRNLA